MIGWTGPSLPSERAEPMAATLAGAGVIIRRLNVGGLTARARPPG